MLGTDVCTSKIIIFTGVIGRKLKAHFKKNPSERKD